MTADGRSSDGHGGVMTEARPAFTARGIPDLLDLLPVLFGFQPTESFIAIAVHGERHRFGFRLRADLPPIDQSGDAAAQIAGLVDRQDPDGVILLALTEDAEAADALMAGVIAAFDGLPIHDAVRSDGESYWPYGRPCPVEGFPYTARCSPAVVGAVFDGMQILPSRSALVERFAPVAGERRIAMELVTEEVLHRWLRTIAQTPKSGLGRVGMAVLAPIIDGHRDGRSLTDTDRATLAIWVSARSVRDEVWNAMSRDNAVGSLALWTEVAQSVVDPFAAPVLSLAAFAAWLTGDGTQALIASERALAAEPGYSMAELILRTLDSGMSPEHWHGFDPGPC